MKPSHIVSDDKILDFYKGLRYFADYGHEYRRIKTVFSSPNMTDFLLEVRGMDADIAGYVVIRAR
jgi:hypothetical protein